MSRKKPLSPKQFRAKTKKYLGTRKPLKGKQASRTVKAAYSVLHEGLKIDARRIFNAAQDRCEPPGSQSEEESRRGHQKTR